MSLRPSKSGASQPQILISGEVMRQIRQHARSSNKTEVCGVLIGNEAPNGTNKIKIAACIAGVNATQAGTHVTFTQDTWEHIYKIKDATFPDERIVGWYHSHPGFGVFLSDHDTFIHKNFFSAPTQVAWVYDPHSDEEGCFGWIGSRLERLTQISVEDAKGGEGAGETGKPEPIFISEEESEEDVGSQQTSDSSADAWVRRSLSLLGLLVFFGAGFTAAWFFLPTRVVIVPVDPYTGRQLGPAMDMHDLKEKLEKSGALDQTKPPQDSGGVAPSSPSAVPEKSPAAAPHVQQNPSSPPAKP